MPRGLRQSILVIVLLGSVSASAGAVAVFDPLNTIEHYLLNGWRESIGIVLTQQLGRIRQMATRLSALTSLVRYVAPNAPPWRIAAISDALPASTTFMDALNGGDPTGARVADASRRRAAVGAAFATLGGNAAAANALRAALATIDLADSAILAGADQTGRIRAARGNEGAVLDALERDVSDPNLDQSATAVADKVSAASLIRARQQQTRQQLLTALTEQLLVDAKRDRDTETAAMNMQLGRLVRGRAVAASLLAGAAEDFRTWRQP